MQMQLRKIQVSIESEQVTNQNLKNVKKFEEELRKNRDDQEREILKVGTETQADSIQWSKNAKKEIEA